MPNPSLGVLCQTKLSNCGSFRSSPAFTAVFPSFNNAFNFSIELWMSWAVDVLWLSQLPIRGIWNSMTDKLQLKVRDHSLCCHIANLSYFKDIWPVKHYYQERSNHSQGKEVNCGDSGLREPWLVFSFDRHRVTAERSQISSLIPGQYRISRTRTNTTSNANVAAVRVSPKWSSDY